MSEGDELAGVYELVLGIAEALREELGASIDAHPGGVGVEAGQVNRAFRAAVRRIVGVGRPGGDEVTGLMTRVLRRAASGRLEAAGISGAVAGRMLDLEPDLGDRWLAYLALAPISVIRDVG